MTRKYRGALALAEQLDIAVHNRKQLYDDLEFYYYYWNSHVQAWQLTDVTYPSSPSKLSVRAVDDLHQSEVFIRVDDVEYKIAVTVGKFGAVRLLLVNEEYRFDMIDHLTKALATRDIVWILPVHS